MIPTPIRQGDDPCLLAQRWGLSLPLAVKLIEMSTENADLGLMIISGARTCNEQLDLGLAGRPTATCSQSTHVIDDRQCFATGADLWTTPSPISPGPGGLNRPVVARFGTAATLAGLRWGGGSPKLDWGAPSDWNHVDLGPRA